MALRETEASQILCSQTEVWEQGRLKRNSVHASRMHYRLRRRRNSSSRCLNSASCPRSTGS